MMFEWKNKAPLYIYIKMCRNAYLYMFNKCSILWGFYQISWDILKYWNEKLNIIFLVNRWLPTFHSWPDIALTSGECLFAVLMVKGKKKTLNIFIQSEKQQSPKFIFRVAFCCVPKVILSMCVLSVYR